jgi:D-3-phosphoglycerate dehydrogenase
MMVDLKNCRILVTPTTFGKENPEIRSTLEEQVKEAIYNNLGRPYASEELMPLIIDVDGYIAGLEKIDRSIFDQANKLRVISRYGVGCDNVDLEIAREMGIVVTNTPGANAVSVAELTIGLLLSLARMIPSAVSSTKAGEWPRSSGVTLKGKVVGLLGFGSIGKQVAQRLVGFECTIFAFDPVPDLAFAEAHGVKFVSREEVVREADFLSLHLPLLPETHEMINDETLNNMKQGSFLINTARGELVDEEALQNALQSGKLHGAALDVFSYQPPTEEHPLLKLPQVIATPHMGSHTDDAMNAMGWLVLRDCLAVLRGEEPVYRVV